MGPHPLPGHTLDGETGPVDVEQNPSVLVLFLPGGPGNVVWGRRARLLLGAAAQETVRTGALGAAVPAQLGRGRPGPSRGVRSRHLITGGGNVGKIILLRTSEVLVVCQTEHVDVKRKTYQGEKQ